MVCGHWLVTLALTINQVKRENGSHRCPPECRSHSDGGSIAICIYPPPSPSLISLMVSMDVKDHVYFSTSLHAYVSSCS